MDDETSDRMGMDLNAYMEARRRRELAAQAEQKAGENYPAWVKACSARATPAPHTEEITIDAPAETLMQRAERMLSVENWTTNAELIDLASDLYCRVAELEADARIKAANANPGEPVEFKGLHGETIVARMVR